MEEMETWEVPALRPDMPMTREDFIGRSRLLLDEMADDHEAATGVEDSELHPWEYWQDELTNAYLNS